MNTAEQTIPRVVYTRMVADLFHYGHAAFLKAARVLGDRLVVHVLDDAYVATIKQASILNQAERAAVIAACRYVDEVIVMPAQKISLSFMHEHGYNLYAIGYANAEEEVFKRNGCRELPAEMIASIPYTPGISTTDIRRRVLASSR